VHVSERDETVGALLVASRALVGVAARSLADIADDVTLPQFRALVVLSRGESTVSALADLLDVHPTTASRLVDRLVRKKLVLRRASVEDRRSSVLSLSARGRRLVDEVTARRVEHLAAIVDRLSPATRTAVVDGLSRFSEAAGEPDDLDLFAWDVGPG
jgi:DNA-binding MarR family transcriptional regulator